MNIEGTSEFKTNGNTVFKIKFHGVFTTVSKSAIFPVSF